ncbi:hypothetical protein MKW94_020723 [Papaver nudicaule]|uniref:AB hydrolase-1 domain-containing protein n=1 Tax=Papaver nudicaule TaxID=74823 RepID=A0AA41VXA4_PAPNU|nr:hypothetical protein [Papaver nudicaule]
MTKIASTLHFVLVHGVGGGSWCWYKIRCLMENSGYKVSCIDLKSAGIDPSDPNKVLKFEDYNQPLVDFLSTIPDHDKIILVGHSAGGLSLTHAILKFGKKIHLAIFIAATMLRLGFWTEQDVKDFFFFLDGQLELVPYRKFLSFYKWVTAVVTVELK